MDFYGSSKPFSTLFLASKREFRRPFAPHAPLKLETPAASDLRLAPELQGQKANGGEKAVEAPEDQETAPQLGKQAPSRRKTYINVYIYILV